MRSDASPEIRFLSLTFSRLCVLLLLEDNSFSVSWMHVRTGQDGIGTGLISHLRISNLVNQ